LPGLHQRVPIPPATVSLSGFPNLSATFFLPSPPRRFRAGGAHGVPPFRGLFHPRSPDGSSPPACPPDVAPFGGPSPLLGGGTSGRAGREPRNTDQHLSSPSGLSSTRESVRVTRSRLMSRRPTCPSWAFASPWVALWRVVGTSVPQTVALGRPQVRRRICGALRSTACRSPELALCHQRSLPSRGSSPTAASPVLASPDAGLFGFALFASARHSPRGAVRASTHRCAARP